MSLLAGKWCSLPVKWREGSQCHSLIDLYPVSDSGGLSDYYTGTVVNEETLADGSTWVDVDSSPGMGPLAHHPWDDRDVLLIKLVCDSVGGNSLKERIAEHNLI